MITLTIIFMAVGFLAGYHFGRWSEKGESMSRWGRIAEDEWLKGYEVGLRAHVEFDHFGDIVADESGEEWIALEN